jgi:hypothetical protein
MKDFAVALVAALFIVGIVMWIAKVMVEILWTR